jgi:catechol 2,3-dioxygenase-like lactoylglutathione lyase family enzyme
VFRETPLYANILVGEIPRARGFYEGILGFEPFRTAKSEVVYRAGSTRFAVSRVDDAGETAHTVGSFVVDDIESVVAGLRARGVRFEDYDLPGLVTIEGIATFAAEGVALPDRVAWFRDSDGNLLSIVQEGS